MDPIPAANADHDAHAFQACLRDVLRFTDRQVNALVKDGYGRADDLAYWTYEDITAWVANKEKLRNNAGGAAFGDMRKKGLIGLAWWVTEKLRTGLPVDVAEFDDDAWRASIIEARVEHDEGKVDAKIDKPNKFKYEEWTKWEKSVYTYLLATNNSLGVPLAYFIHTIFLITKLNRPFFTKHSHTTPVQHLRTTPTKKHKTHTKHLFPFQGPLCTFRFLYSCPSSSLKRR